MEALSFITAFVLSFALVTVIWAIKGILLRPAVKGKGINVSVVLSVKGKAPQLEHTVSGLRWLRKNGSLRANILIIDDGMDTDTAEAAKLLCNMDYIQTCKPDKAAEYLTRSSGNGGTE